MLSKQKKGLSIKLEKVYISVDELVQQLRKYQEVSAISNGYQFETIKDIENNKALFSGNPTINIGKLQIWFFDSSIHLDIMSRDMSDQAQANASDIEKFLINYTGRFRKKTNAVMIWLFLWSVIFMSIVGKFYSDNLTSEHQNQPIYWLMLLNFAAVLIPVGYAVIQTLYRKFMIEDNQVYYNPRKNFWQRNQDKLLVGLIMLVIGAFVGKLL